MEIDHAIPGTLEQIPWALKRLAWMRERHIWPNGPRYLWTDAFGVVLLVSLYRASGDVAYLREAERVVAAVERVLGRPRGIRIGEAADRDGQYYHYLAMWLFALHCLGQIQPHYRRRALALVRAIHPAFVVPGTGVIWKMREDLSGPYPGYGLGALDPFHGYVVYRLLDEAELAPEIAEMKALVERSFRSLLIRQDLGLGVMLWLTHFFPGEGWACLQRERSLDVLSQLWVDPPGYFCREPGLPRIKFAFTNYGISLGLQAVGVEKGRVRRINAFFDKYRAGDEYDVDAITHVMACVSHVPGAFIGTGQAEAIGQEGV